MYLKKPTNEILIKSEQKSYCSKYLDLFSIFLTLFIFVIFVYVIYMKPKNTDTNLKPIKYIHYYNVKVKPRRIMNLFSILKSNFLRHYKV